MEALTDNVHKQREHIPQHCYISHNHPYVSSSDTLVNRMCRDGCVKCSNVVGCALLVCVLCQPVTVASSCHSYACYKFFIRLIDCNAVVAVNTNTPLYELYGHTCLVWSMLIVSVCA